MRTLLLAAVLFLVATPAPAGPLEEELVSAIMQGDVDAVRQLMEQGADLQYHTPEALSLREVANWTLAVACQEDPVCELPYRQIDALLESAGAPMH